MAHRYPRPADPLALARSGADLAMLAWEAQLVMTMRLMGMAGLWSVVPTENGRMMSEKGPAFLEAAQSATQAAMTGCRPDQVVVAWARPLRKRTRANAHRLSKRGPRLG